MTADLGNRSFIHEMSRIDALREQLASREAEVVFVMQVQNPRYGITLAVKISQCNGRGVCDLWEDGDDGGVARKRLTRFRNELRQSQAIG